MPYYYSIGAGDFQDSSNWENPAEDPSTPAGPPNPDDGFVIQSAITAEGLILSGKGDFAGGEIIGGSLIDQGGATLGGGADEDGNLNGGFLEIAGGGSATFMGKVSLNFGWINVGRDTTGNPQQGGGVANFSGGLDLGGGAGIAIVYGATATASGVDAAGSGVEVDGSGSTFTDTGVLTLAGGDLTVSDAGVATLTGSVSNAAGGGIEVTTGGQLVVEDTLTLTGSPAEGGGLYIDGAGSTLTATSPAILTINSGGGWSMADGASAFVTGKIDIDGGSFLQLFSGSTLTNTGTTIVGDTGEATFSLESGSHATLSGPTTFGNQTDSDAKVSINGKDTELSVYGTFVVGNQGDGEVDVTGGGELNVKGTTTLADGKQGFGALVVDGKGSTFDADGNVVVGNDGGGGLVIGGGASATIDGDLTIAKGEGGLGSVVTVTGKGTTLTVTQNLDIAPTANSGDGDVFFGEGAHVVIQGNLIAGSPSKQNETPRLLVVKGGILDVRGNVEVYGLLEAQADPVIHGDLTIAGGGAAIAGVPAANQFGAGAGLQIGAGQWTVEGETKIGETRAGTMILDGSTTTFTANADVTVGDTANGSLTIRNGALFDAQGIDFTMGQEANVTGLVAVTGQGSTLLTGDLTVGDQGKGDLVEQNGALIATTGDLDIAQEAGSGSGHGLVDAEVDNSELDVGGNLTIGDGGTGDMVLSGAVASVSGTEISVGDQNGATGTLTVNVSTLAFGGELKIGDNGIGTVFIQQGSTVNAGTLTVGNNGTGTLNLDGFGTTLSTVETTIGGGSGKGTLKITNGATLTTADQASVGGAASGFLQTVTVDTGSTWAVLHSLTIGDNSTATVTVKDGSTLAADGDLMIGNAGGGSLTVTGASTIPTSLGYGGSLIVGSGAQGMLTISSGALAAPTKNGSGIVEIAALTGSNGSTLTVTGTNSSLTATKLSIGGTTSTAGGTGTLALSSKGKVAIAQQLVMWSGSEISFTGSSPVGSVQVGGGSAVSGAVSVGVGGMLSGAGTIAGNLIDTSSVTAAHGLLAINNNGALSGGGTLTIDSGATLDLSNTANGDSIGTLIDDGALSLGSRTLTVVNSYSNSAWQSETGNTFDANDNVTGTGGITGKNAQLKIVGADVSGSGSSFALQFHDTTGSLEQATFQIENDGTGASVVAALQTLALTDNDITLTNGNGATIANGDIVNLAKDATSQTYTLTYDSSINNDGDLNSQSLRVVSDFGNVAPITIMLDAPKDPVAVVAVGASPAGPVTTGQTVLITLTMNAGITVTNGSTPTLTLSDGGIASYSAADSDATHLVFSYTVGAGQHATNLGIAAVNTTGVVGSVDFSNAIAGLGLQVGGPVVTGITSSASEVDSGQVAKLTLSLNEAVTVTGSPTLTLSDGGTATYDRIASNAAAGLLVFDYTATASQRTTAVKVSQINLNGGTIRDGTGLSAITTVGLAAGLQVNSLLTVTSVTPSQTGTITGGILQITLAMSEAMTVDISNGAPTLTLSNGAIATYDADASNPAAKKLVFDYAIGPGDQTVNLGVAGVSLNGANIQDASGYNADFAHAIKTSIGVSINPAIGQVKPAAVVAVTTSPNEGDLIGGGVLTVTLHMNGAVTVDTTNGEPKLTFSDGGTASYNSADSQPGAGLLVFTRSISVSDYAVGLKITGLTPNGGTVEDASGNAANFVGALATLPIDLNATVVTGFTAPLDTGATAGQVIQLTLTLSGAVTVNGGSPALKLNDGGTATFDAANSNPSAGTLVFDYTVGASDKTVDLSVAAILLKGATILDANSNPVDLGGAINQVSGLSVGASPLTVTGVTTSPGSNSEADAGSLVQITVHMGEGVAIQGFPELTLNTGGTAFYDSSASNLATGAIVFDYTTGSTDRTSNLEITGFTGSAGSVTDTSGYQANFAKAENVATGLQIGSTYLTAITSSKTGSAVPGAKLILTLAMSGKVTVTGSPSLTLNNGASAIYDAAASSPSTGKLAFEYTVGANDQTAALKIDSVNPNGGSIVDAFGQNVNFAASPSINTNLAIGAQVGVDDVFTTAQGNVEAGQKVTFTFDMTNNVKVTGTPTLALSDGGKAVYNAKTSNVTEMNFDYVVGATDHSTNLTITGVNLPSGTSVADSSGNAVSFARATNFATHLVIGPPTVTSVSAEQFGSAVTELNAGIVQILLNVDTSTALTLTSGTLATLTLSDGRTATYDPNNSRFFAGDADLAFDYTISAGDTSPDLSINSVNLHGATLKDAHGQTVNLASAVGLLTGLQVGPSPFSANSVSITPPPGGEFAAGDNVTITLVMSEAATVVGAPTLTLNDGGTATYDAAASNTSTGKLVFDYQVATGDETPGLAITAVKTSAENSIKSASGYAGDYSSVLGASGGPQVGPAFVTSATASQTGEADAGATVQLTLIMDQAVTVSGTPELLLNTGRDATYVSALTSTELVFDYTISAGDRTAALQITGLDSNHSGGTVTDANGVEANLSSPPTHPLALQIGPTVVDEVAVTSGGVIIASGGTSLRSSAHGEIDSGQVQLIAEFGSPVSAVLNGGMIVAHLNDGGTATFDAIATSLLQIPNELVFDAPISSGQLSPNLAITGIATSGGATITNSAGKGPDFSGIGNVGTGLQIGPSPLTISSVAASTPLASEGDTVSLTLTMSEAATVLGSPKITLSNGGIATYDAAATQALNQPTKLVFDYTVGADETTSALAITAINLPVGSVVRDGSGYNLSVIGPVSTGLAVTPLAVQNVVVSETGEANTGDVVQVTLALTEGVSVNTGGGVPTLSLSNGAIATYDAVDSDPAGANSAAGTLVFDYTVSAGDTWSPDISISKLNLNGATIADTNGNALDTAAALNIGTGLQIGPSPLTVSAVIPSQTGFVSAGTTVQLVLTMSEDVTVAGIPALILNDGGEGVYDANATAALNDATKLVFNYTVGADDETPNLEITGVDLDGGTVDANGYSADFADVYNKTIGGGIAVGPAFVASIAATPHGEAVTGRMLGITLNFSRAVTVTGTPTLTLSDGGTAIYDAAASNQSAGVLVFDYTVRSQDISTNLKVTGIGVANGASIVDDNGQTPDLSGALNTGLGVSVNETVPTITIDRIDGANVLSGSSRSTSLTISGTETDASGGTVTVKLNGASYTTLASQSGTWSITVPTTKLTPAELPNGSYIVTADVSDSSGHAAQEATQSLVVGGGHLVASLTLGTVAGDNIINSAEAAAGVTISGTGSGGNGDTVVVTILDQKGNPFETATGLAANNVWSAKLTAAQAHALADGNYTVQAYLTDPIGDISSPTQRAITVHEQVPKISGVSTTPLSGGLVGIGTTIEIDLDFSDAPLTVSGSPILTLSDGGTARYDGSASSPTSGLLQFDYTVASGQTASNLTITGESLNGGSVVDGAGNAASFSLTNSETKLGIAVNGIAPKVTSVTNLPPKGGDIITAATVLITLHTTEPVTVVGSPALTLDDGGLASYVSGSGTTALVFSYSVGTQTTTDLQVTGITQSAGNTINDAAGNQLSSTLSANLGLDVNVFTFTKTSGGGGQWNTSTNWGPNGIPGAADTALITEGGTYTVSSTETNSVYAVDIAAGATLVVDGGTVFETTSLSAAGVNAGKIAVADSGTLELGGSFINSGTITIASGAEVEVGGILTVASGGLVSGTSVSATTISGGKVNVLSGGKLTFATVSSGGELNVSKGGSTASIVVSSGGNLNVAGTTTSNVTVSSGGMETVSSGGIAGGTTIAGGMVEITSGGSTGGTVTFAANSGTLLLDANNFSGTVAGMTAQDTIDLRDFAFGTVHVTSSVTATSATLTVTDGADIAHLLLIGNYIGSMFTPSNDGFGGTSIVDPHVSASQIATLVQAHR